MGLGQIIVHPRRPPRPPAGGGRVSVRPSLPFGAAAVVLMSERGEVIYGERSSERTRTALARSVGDGQSRLATPLTLPLVRNSNDDEEERASVHRTRNGGCGSVASRHSGSGFASTYTQGPLLSTHFDFSTSDTPHLHVDFRIMPRDVGMHEPRSYTLYWWRKMIGCAHSTLN